MLGRRRARRCSAALLFHVKHLALGGLVPVSFPGLVLPPAQVGPVPVGPRCPVDTHSSRRHPPCLFPGESSARLRDRGPRPRSHPARVASSPICTSDDAKIHTTAPSIAMFHVKHHGTTHGAPVFPVRSCRPRGRRPSPCAPDSCSHPRQRLDRCPLHAPDTVDRSSVHQCDVVVRNLADVSLVANWSSR